MKTVIGLCIVAAFAGWHYAQNDNELNLSDLALENVEALAQNEGGDGYCSKRGMGCIIKYSDGSSTFVSGRWN